MSWLHMLVVLNIGTGWVLSSRTEDSCEGSVCRALTGNIEALMAVRKELGCCTHASCVAGAESEICSQQLVFKMQPCLQFNYGGNRMLCHHKAAMPHVCQNVEEKCEALRAVTEHLNLASDVVGCSMRASDFVGSAFS